MLAIDAVDRVDPERIADADARRAGFADPDGVRAAAARARGATVYRIALPRSPAPTRASRCARTPRSTPAARAAIAARLARLDAASRHGAVDRGDAARDRARARACAPATSPSSSAASGSPFKADVRKLKALGLTESLEVGYRLSPRGRAYLDGG